MTDLVWLSELNGASSPLQPEDTEKFSGCQACDRDIQPIICSRTTVLVSLSSLAQGSLEQLFVSLQAHVSCVEPFSERGCVCVLAVPLQESQDWAWASQLQCCRFCRSLRSVSCVWHWIKMGSAEASRQSDHRGPTGVYRWRKMVQLARFGKGSVINSVG